MALSWGYGGGNHKCFVPGFARDLVRWALPTILSGASIEDLVGTAHHSKVWSTICRLGSQGILVNGIEINLGHWSRVEGMTTILYGNVD